VGTKAVKPEHIDSAMRAIQASKDPEQLKRLMERAQEMGVSEVYNAAFAKRLSLLPDEAPGTVAHDLWKSIHAQEQIRSEEEGRTVRLSRTRQKIQRVGIMKVLEDFATHPTSTQGFDMLIERSLPELTGEAIVLRHRQHFSEDVVRAAGARLERFGVDISKLPGV
jgi:hypothetical protein